MKKKWLIKKWNNSADYWSYLREEPSKIFGNMDINNFIGGKVENAKLFDSLQETEKELDNYLLTFSYFKIDIVYINHTR